MSRPIDGPIGPVSDRDAHLAYNRNAMTVA